MTQYARPEKNLLIAVPAIIMAALMNAAMIASAKYIQMRVQNEIVVFIRNLVIFMMVMSIFTVHKAPILHNLKTKRSGLHLFRAITGLAAAYAYFYVANHIPLGEATLLYFTSPLFVPIITFFWLKLKIHHRLWWGIGIGFIGIAVILQPTTLFLHPAALVGLCSGIFFSLIIVSVRLLGYTEPPNRTIFYFMGITTIIAGFVCVPLPLSAWRVINFTDTLWLIAVGVFCYCYQWFLSFAAKHAPVRLTSSLLYFSVLFAVYFDWIFWSAEPGPSIWLGSILVIVGSCLVLFMYPKEDYQLRTETK